MCLLYMCIYTFSSFIPFNLSVSHYSLSPSLPPCHVSSQCGVIEVVPDSKSRDKIGKQTQASLRGYFHSVYGSEDSIPYQGGGALYLTVVDSG